MSRLSKNACQSASLGLQALRCQRTSSSPLISGTGAQLGRLSLTQFRSRLRAESPPVSTLSKSQIACQFFRPGLPFKSGTLAAHSLALGDGSFLGSLRAFIRAIDSAKSSSRSILGFAAATWPNLVKTRRRALLNERCSNGFGSARRSTKAAKSSSTLNCGMLPLEVTVQLLCYIVSASV